MSIPLFILRFYQAENGVEPYKEWINKIKDKKVRAIISARVFRLELGLFGDVRSVGDGISELRFHIGPGYRLYYACQEGQIILLLCGGNKTSQSQDILKAKKYLQDYNRRLK